MKKHKLVLCLFSAALLLTSCNNKNKNYELVEVPADIKATIKDEIIIKNKIVNEEFPIRAVADRSLEAGKYKIVQKGRRGKSQVRLELHYHSGKLISSKPLYEVVDYRALPDIIHYGPLYRDPSPEGKVYSLGFSHPDMEEPDYDKLLADKGLIPLSDKMIAKWNKQQRNKPNNKKYNNPKNSNPEYGSGQSESSENSTSSDSSSSSEASEQTTSRPNTSKPATSSERYSDPLPISLPSDGSEKSKEDGENKSSSSL